jgi:energy-converting hydrogenase Eha subunit C
MSTFIEVMLAAFLGAGIVCMLAAEYYLADIANSLRRKP